MLSCSAGRSGVVVPVLVLLIGALRFVLRGNLLYVLPRAILFLYFSVLLALRLPRFGAGLGAFRVFGQFVLVWLCRFPLPLNVREGLRFVIVALPGLFSYLFYILRGNLFYVLPCVILLLCFSVHLALRLPRYGKRELILVLFVRLFDLRLFGLSVSSASWCLGRAAVCDCGTSWSFLLPFCLVYSIHE